MARVMSNAELCPNCGTRLIAPRGKPSEILIAGEFPGYMEINMGVPWVGEAGDVLEKELNRVGLSLNACRSTNLWLHKIPDDAPSKKAEFDFHFKRLLEEIGQAKYVLLCGSELGPLMFGHKISTINGLVYKKLDKSATIDWLKKGQVAVASYNPAVCLNTEGVVGDFRFAIERFGEIVKKGKKK